MRFLFCSLNSPGFLYPSIGIAQELQKRGHEVAFATDQKLGPFLAALGFCRIPRGKRDGKSFNVEEWVSSFQVAIQVKHIEFALERFPADVLVGQSLTLGPLLASERTGIPVAILGFSTYLWPVTGDRLADNPELEELLAWRHAETVRWWNQARALFRLPLYNGGYDESPFLGDLYLVRNVPKLEPRARSLPDRVHLVGSCLWEPEQPEPELERWLAESVLSGQPVIYVQHGRTFHVPAFWHQLVEALGNRNCRVIASVSRMDNDIGNLPGNFFAHPCVPQGRVLRQASAVVASANTTVVLGTIEGGIPSLLIPAGGEQPDVAALAIRYGFARVLKAEEVTPGRLREELDQLLADGSYREQALRASRSLAKVNSFERVGDLLEVLAETRQPVLRRKLGAHF